jgi:glycosyltransferase involved in cell wall biosynthesis
LKKIIFTVTNDLAYDQRMRRICDSLAHAGYDVELVGVRSAKSSSLEKRSYKQTRLGRWFKRGYFFYAEYNIRLFFFLLFKKAHCICAIDLDTILPVYYVSKLKNVKRVYDAHEYFSQLDEVVSRPRIYRFWHRIEKKMLPRFKNGYTVCKSIADEFEKHYGIRYSVIRNMPFLKPIENVLQEPARILYQGAVNKGRGLEQIVAAMKQLDAELLICGNGNFMQELKESIQANGVASKVKLTGMVKPEELKKLTVSARVAINPFDKRGLNQYYSLSNKFFDYIHAGVPQVTMNYPEYRAMNDQFEVAVLIDELSPSEIEKAIKKLLSDDGLHARLFNNCKKAREVLNWQQEEKVLIDFYRNILNG